MVASLRIIVIKWQKSMCIYGGESIFTGKCTLAIASSTIKAIAFFHFKNGKEYWLTNALYRVNWLLGVAV